MKKLIALFCFLFVSGSYVLLSQAANKEILAKGVNFIETRTYTAEEDTRILEMYKNLRVADVSDGLDMVGLPGTGLVNPEIHACWTDMKDFKHVFRGIAHQLLPEAAAWKGAPPTQIPVIKLLGYWWTRLSASSVQTETEGR